MVSILKEVELDEISLVDRPANQHATVLFFKKDERVAKGMLPADIILKARGDGIITDKEREQRRQAAKARWRRWAGNVGLPVNPKISEDRVTSKESNRLARTGVLLETRGEPTGAAAGAAAGAGLGGYLGYKAMTNPALHRYIGNKLVYGGATVGEKVGVGLGRLGGAVAQVAGYGVGTALNRMSRRIPISGAVRTKLFQMSARAPAAGGQAGAWLGRRFGYAVGATARGAGSLAGNVIRGAAGSGRKAGLIAGVAAAIPAAYYGAQLGGSLGRNYDLFSYRRVER